MSGDFVAGYAEDKVEDVVAWLEEGREALVGRDAEGYEASVYGGDDLVPVVRDDPVRRFATHCELGRGGGSVRGSRGRGQGRKILGDFVFLGFAADLFSAYSTFIGRSSQVISPPASQRSSCERPSLSISHSRLTG